MADLDQTNIYGDLDVKGNDVKNVDTGTVDSLIVKYLYSGGGQIESFNDIFVNGGKIEATEGFFGSGSGLTNLSGTHSGLRAQATTKADVGLGSVDNYSRSYYDSRYYRSGDSASFDKLNITNGGSVSSGHIGFEMTRNSQSFRMHMSHSNLFIEPSNLDQGNGIVINNSNGNVGIGTGQNPSTRLAVNGKLETFDDIYANGGKIEATEGFYGDGSGLNNLSGTHSSLRAQATTKADVGLGSVDNYSRSHYDGRYASSSHTHSNFSSLGIGVSSASSSSLHIQSGSHSDHIRLERTGSNEEDYVFGFWGTRVFIGNGTSHDTNKVGFYIDEQGEVEFPNSTSGISYNDLSNVPSSFNPSSHTHSASDITSGTISTSRLPSSALVGDTTYSAGTGLSLSSGTFSVDNPFNPSGTYSGLRAQGTTKGDVGLSSVGNYSRAHYDGRYVRTGSTNQSIAGTKTFTGDVNIDRLFMTNMGSNASRVGLILQRNSAEFGVHMSRSMLHIEPLGDQGDGLVMDSNGNVIFGGDVSARKLETFDDILANGGKIEATEGFFGDGSGLNNLSGTHSSLRAQATTKGDVGLGSVDNYSRSYYDGRYASSSHTHSQYLVEAPNHHRLKLSGLTGADSDQVWLLCRTTGGSHEVIGKLYGQRSSGHYEAFLAEIVISTTSSGSNSSNRAGLRSTVLRNGRNLTLHTCVYNGTSYFCLRWHGGSYMLSDVFFDGYAEGDSNLFKNLDTSEVSSLSSSITNATDLTSGFNHDFEVGGTLKASSIEEGGTSLSSKYSPVNHSHSASDIVTGTLSISRIPSTTSTSSTSTSHVATASAVRLAMNRANEAFQSASDGKNSIKYAITGKFGYYIDNGGNDFDDIEEALAGGVAPIYYYEDNDPRLGSNENYDISFDGLRRANNSSWARPSNFNMIVVQLLIENGTSSTSRRRIVEYINLFGTVIKNDFSGISTSNVGQMSIQMPSLVSGGSDQTLRIFFVGDRGGTVMDDRTNNSMSITSS